MNEPILTTISVVVAAAVVAVLVIALVRSAGERGMQRFARMHGLDRISGADDASDAEQQSIDATLRRAIITRARWTAGIGALGVAAIALICLLVPDLFAAPYWTLPLIAVLYLSIVVASATSSTLSAVRERHAAGPRVARLDSPSLTDYVPPIELVSMRITAGLALVASVTLVVLLVALPDVADRATGIWSAASAAITLAALFVVVESVVRLIVSNPRRASTEHALQWDDALRSSTIRGLVNLPTVLAMLVGLFVASQLSSLLEPAGIVVVMVAFLVFPGIVLTLAIIAAANSPELYYLKRLWPEQATRVDASFRTQSVEEHARS
ncbi:hypothetical protein [Agromyces atrinae]|uniref:Uncharacterized protein n=1 Tax=Agromyces atrinae TaxID=592376 RepID=A0A4Q2M827_9MICO|nr:hypothetical protein [Agromyces atrinae]NYD67614.1 hypothetical protein [Agromyces atrinae]RXZ88178.1 hypothetical protein ESP50_03075 [Agromyces atrinae]